MILGQESLVGIGLGEGVGVVNTAAVVIVLLGIETWVVSLACVSKGIVMHIPTNMLKEIVGIVLFFFLTAAQIFCMVYSSCKTTVVAGKRIIKLNPVFVFSHVNT